MSELKMLGAIFVFISIILSMLNLFFAKITGGVVGVAVKTPIMIILPLIFLFLGILFISRIGKGLAALVLTGLAVGGVAHKINSDRENQYETDIKVTAPAATELGRFQRTYRWDEILDKVEQKYNLPKGILKGLAMQESYGDPLRLNEGKDGGAGLFMFQPRTARAYGLKVYGNSDRSSADYNHGKELKKLIKEKNYSYEEMAKIDERFDIHKAPDAAARYLLDDFKRYGSWDKVLSAYNQGTPAPNASETKHVKAVNDYTKYYNQRDKIDHKYNVKKVNSKGHSNDKLKGKK